MTEFKGFVSHIIYRNEENSYTVFEMTLTDAENEVGEVLTCVGWPVSISEGESCAVTGDYTTHPVYGEQLKVQSYQAVAPETA